MPADRLLHPRCGHSGKVAMLTDLEYRVWTQYLLSADDFGVMRALPAQLQADNDHLLNRPVKMLQRCLDAIMQSGLVHRFEHQGKPYVFQRDWQRYQKVEWPRATNNPKPNSEMLALCDDATRKLFDMWPGGASRKKATHVPSTSQVDPETDPSIRARAPAERLTANGQRLTANGLERGPGETNPPLDMWFRELVAAYPEHRRSDGHLAMTAFVDTILAQGTPNQTFAVLLANLENQKRGHQWRTNNKMIPRLDRWLREGLWKQIHDEDAPIAEQLSPRTLRMLGGA